MESRVFSYGRFFGGLFSGKVEAGDVLIFGEKIGSCELR